MNFLFDMLRNGKVPQSFQELPDFWGGLRRIQKDLWPIRFANTSIFSGETHT